VPEMSYGETCHAIDNIKDAFKSWVTEYGMEVSPSFHFTGGEPFLRKDLFAILDYARYRGFPVSLMTNGTLITSEVARRIREAGVTDVQASLDGLETVHNTIRGHDSFGRALEGIDNLISAGVDTSINLTVSRLNMDQIAELVKLAEQHGISAVSVSRLVPCGQGKELCNEMLNPRELCDLYRNLHRLKTTSKVAVVSRDPLALIAEIEDEAPETEFPVGGCAAGVFGVTIATDGSIMPCRRMNLSIGNIKDRSFRKVWAESPVLWSLRNRESYHDGCKTCRYWAICRGCRAVALAFSESHGGRDFLGPDPQCPYYRPSESICTPIPPNRYYSLLQTR